MKSDLGGGRGLKLPEIGLGTWRIGGSFTPDHSEDKESAEAIAFALDLGFRLIDTAEMYGSGNSESIVGRAAKGRDVILATKVWNSNLRYDDLIKAADRSLGRLGVKTIDLYQVHWPNDSIPLRETMRAMEKLVEEGKIRHIGVSNFDAQLLDDARSYLSREEIVSDQVSYSLVDRTPEYELMDYCRREGIRILAYEPLARMKVLTGKTGRAIEAVAKKCGRTPVQVALNWIISKGAIPIPKSTDRKHLEENIRAAGWRLDPGDVRLLDGTGK